MAEGNGNGDWRKMAIGLACAVVGFIAIALYDVVKKQAYTAGYEAARDKYEAHHP